MSKNKKHDKQRKSTPQEKCHLLLSELKLREIKPKTQGQINYLKAIDESRIVIASAPAGTGKTLLSIYKAITMFREGKIKKIVISRPLVEAGEKLGFLPGGIDDKTLPFMMPIYDEINNIFSGDTTAFQKLIERKVVETVPVAFLRGRTLKDAFIIIDEAQNLTTEQFKMAVTRIGMGSKMIVNGDPSQLDIRKDDSGLIYAVKLFKLMTVEGVKVVEMEGSDIVRDKIVRDVLVAINAFESEDVKKKEKK